ncbi:MAG: FMN-dependent NADH-azoreductase [Maribacter sp.]
MNVLHIDSSIRLENSLSRILSKKLVEQLQAKKPITIDRLDLAKDVPPHISNEYAEAMYNQESEQSKETKNVLAYSDGLVQRLEDTQLYVIGLPMYNFSVPSNFKSFIDYIVRSGKTFTADENGYHGLLKNKKVIIICSSGGEYENKQTSQMDFARPYVKMILGFIGIEDVTFINVQPTLFYGEEAKEKAMKEAEKRINSIVVNL